MRSNGRGYRSTLMYPISLYFKKRDTSTKAAAAAP